MCVDKVWSVCWQGRFVCWQGLVCKLTSIISPWQGLVCVDKVRVWCAVCLWAWCEGSPAVSAVCPTRAHGLTSRRRESPVQRRQQSWQHLPCCPVSPVTSEMNICESSESSFTRWDQTADQPCYSVSWRPVWLSVSGRDYIGKLLTFLLQFVKHFHFTFPSYEVFCYHRRLSIVPMWAH